MKRVVVLLSIVAASALLVTNAYAQKCDGNACGDVPVTWDGSCYHATNKGSKSVKVEFNPTGVTSSVSKVLGPGEDWKPQVYGGACVNSFKDPYHANYVK